MASEEATFARAADYDGGGEGGGGGVMSESHGDRIRRLSSCPLDFGKMKKSPSDV